MRDVGASPKRLTGFGRQVLNYQLDTLAIRLLTDFSMYNNKNC